MHTNQVVIEHHLAPAFHLPPAIQLERLAIDKVNRYLTQHLGNCFIAVEPRFFEQISVWFCFIQYAVGDLIRPVIAGRIQIDARTGDLIPLTDEEILQIQERACILAERQRGNQLAFGSDGFILPYQAMIKAGVYASDQIAFFAGAAGRPTFAAGDPPVWRVAIALHLRNRGKVADLGSVDVNALTGEVLHFGLDDENVYLNDPFFADAPIPVKIDYFLSAWADRDEQYAIISLIEPG